MAIPAEYIYDNEKCESEKTIENGKPSTPSNKRPSSPKKTLAKLPVGLALPHGPHHHQGNLGT